MECNFSDPLKLPKNFAMLKVLERHQQAQVVSLVTFAALQSILTEFCIPTENFDSRILA